MRGANKTKRPHRRTNSGLHGGKPPFVATADQKRMVMALAGLRMSWDEMRQIVRNPHTDQPIAKATFARVFKRELAEGGAGKCYKGIPAVVAWLLGYWALSGAI